MLWKTRTSCTQTERWTGSVTALEQQHVAHACGTTQSKVGAAWDAHALKQL